MPVDHYNDGTSLYRLNANVFTIVMGGEVLIQHPLLKRFSADDDPYTVGGDRGLDTG